MGVRIAFLGPRSVFFEILEAKSEEKEVIWSSFWLLFGLKRKAKGRPEKQKKKEDFGRPKAGFRKKSFREWVEARRNARGP